MKREHKSPRPPMPDRMNTDKLERRIVRKTGMAIGDFELIQEGDKILVAVSGGKDSWSLLYALEILRRRAPVSFSLIAVNLHHNFPGYRADLIEAQLKSDGFEYHMARRDIAGLLEAKLKPDEAYCPLCARIRRGALYNIAPELGCNKIALGHHKDDLVETLLLNIFFTGQLKSMPPLLRSDDGRNTVIRPLAYVDESDLAAYAQCRNLPIVSCSCPASGVRDNKQRREVKELLAQLEQKHPGLKSSILTAMRHVVPSHLMDYNLHPRDGQDELN